VLACLRSAQFIYPDYSGGIVVELRRHHDTAASCDNKAFIVTKRLTRLPSVLMAKSFGTYAEACRYWDEQVAKVTDTGLERRDAMIIGWHEEG
jgi:hypothetical protein